MSALAWNRSLLSTGTRSGAIFNHDIRSQHSAVQTLQGGHCQEICGLKWSPDRRYLASGGNDNIVSVWDNAGNTVHQWAEHNAAVKAIAWCPWQSSLLATGGGTDDRTIKMWNVNLGSRNLLATTETKSQISSLIWNTHTHMHSLLNVFAVAIFDSFGLGFPKNEKQKTKNKTKSTRAHKQTPMFQHNVLFIQEGTF